LDSLSSQLILQLKQDLATELAAQRKESSSVLLEMT
jgi:hypothetical protein